MRKRSSKSNHSYNKRHRNNNYDFQHSNEVEEYPKDYNPNNRLLTKEFVEGLLKQVFKTSIRIYDLRKYQLAFVHKSVYKRDISPHTSTVLREIARAKANGTNPNQITANLGTWNNGESVVFFQTYEALEFVGDGWVGAIVGDYLYHRFPRQNEGFLTKLKQNIVCKDGLASLSKYIGFDKYILLSTRNEENYGRTNPSYMEDVFEAFCAAIKQDLGKQVLDLFIKNIIEASVDFETIITIDTNYKDTLMRYFQENGWRQPTYSDISEEGSKHNKIYTVGVDYIPEIGLVPNLPPPIVIKCVNKNGNNSLFGVNVTCPQCKFHINSEHKDEIITKKFIRTATGKSKKDAQKLAAKLSLEWFKKYLSQR